MKRNLIIALTIIAFAAMLFAMACEPPPPPPQDWGCSPGFWKNHTEVEYWGDISPDALYITYFESTPVDGLTLLEALRLRGNYADIRYSVADLLNTTYGTDGSTCND